MHDPYVSFDTAKAFILQKHSLFRPFTQISRLLLFILPHALLCFINKISTLHMLKRRM